MRFRVPSSSPVASGSQRVSGAYDLPTAFGRSFLAGAALVPSPRRACRRTSPLPTTVAAPPVDSSLSSASSGSGVLSSARVAFLQRAFVGRGFSALLLRLWLRRIVLQLGPCLLRSGILLSLPALPRASFRRLPLLRSSRILCCISADLGLFVGVPLPRMFRPSILCWRRHRVFVWVLLQRSLRFSGVFRLEDQRPKFRPLPGI